MGIDGAVIAVGALFLLVYIVPQITRRRAVFADAPIGERYSEDLRLITGRTLHDEGGDHGKIFTTERTMSIPTRRSATRGPDAAKMRAIARDRSRARARIARRHAYQQRVFIGGGAIALVALALWVAVGATSLAAGWAIAATAMGGVYLIGAGYLVTQWSALNATDEERIAKSTKALGRAATKRAHVAKAERAARAETSVDRAQVEAVAAGEAVTADEAVKSMQSEPPQTKTVQAVDAAPRVAHKPVQRKASSAGEGATASANVPSYTLKPVRRKVKPYVAPEAPTAEVPFRPTRLGERLGAAALESAHPAPEMTGAEELRSDVLGGGSTLDALLDRRRA
ncbi:hypothetical protein [Trueperella pyogenes]|uniref:hypothetical protein n=1 Tax=Trueperella pyogenes TaxID=1661 RepID=UPI00345C7503